MVRRALTVSAPFFRSDPAAFDMTEETHLATYWSRRAILLSVPLGFAACSRTDRMCASGSPLDDALCRAERIRDSAPAYITAAMLVGAVLGAGISIALRSNPIVGAIGGAMIAGGAMAVDRYIEYRLETAHGDAIRAAADMTRDIRTDLADSTMEVSDLKFAIRQIQQTLADTGGRQYEQARIISRAHQAGRVIAVNGQAYQRSSEIYREGLQQLPPVDPSTPEQVVAIGSNAFAVANNMNFLYRIMQDVS